MGLVIRAFKTKQPYLLFFLPFIIAAFWGRWFMNPQVNWDVDTLMPLSALLLNSFEHLPVVVGLVTILSILFTSYGLFYINERYQILRKGSNLPSLIYLLLVSALSSCVGFNPVVFAAFFMLIAFERLLYSYNNHRSISAVFDVGLAIGTATGFYLYSGAFLVFGIIGLIMINRIGIREFFALIIGFVLPAIFIGTYYYCTDAMPVLIEKINFNLTEGLSSMDFNIHHWIFIALVAFLYIVSLAGMFLRNPLREIFETKFFVLLFWLTLLGLALPLLLFPQGVEIVFIINIAVAFFISRYFVVQRHSWLGDFFLLLFLAAVVLLQFPDFINYLIYG